MGQAVSGVVSGRDADRGWRRRRSLRSGRTGPGSRRRMRRWSRRPEKLEEAAKAGDKAAFAAAFKATWGSRAAGATGPTRRAELPWKGPGPGGLARLASSVRQSAEGRQSQGRLVRLPYCSLLRSASCPCFDRNPGCPACGRRRVWLAFRLLWRRCFRRRAWAGAAGGDRAAGVEPRVGWAAAQVGLCVPGTRMRSSSSASRASCRSWARARSGTVRGWRSRTQRVADRDVAGPVDRDAGVETNVRS